MDIEGEVLCGMHLAHSLKAAYLILPVSQFTLLAETKKGNKPDFRRAAKPEVARELYQHFLEKIKAFYSPDKVKDGLFQAMMEVKLVNDGPVGVDYCSLESAVISRSSSLLYGETPEDLTSLT